MSTLFQSVGFLVYAVLLTGLFWFVLVQRQRRRKGRFPMPENMRAMRRAGEHLSAELSRLDHEFETNTFVVILLPLVGLGLPLWVTGPLGATKHAGVLVACVALLLAAVIYSMRRLLATTDEFRTTRLALYGERVVGDHLMTLAGDGYEVFHDVPCLGGGGPFNLDHVVVGRGAVGVVETKTYSKRSGVNGKDHEVSYDGERLIWPDGTSTKELEQVTRGAEWLQRELRKILNLDAPVRAALTMPGWYVKGGPPKAPVLVENTRRLPQFIRERFQGGLTREQEELVKRHLRSLCETVAYEAI